jgi:hypothetical protein
MSKIYRPPGPPLDRAGLAAILKISQRKVDRETTNALKLAAGDPSGEPRAVKFPLPHIDESGRKSWTSRQAQDYFDAREAYSQSEAGIQDAIRRAAAKSEAARRSIAPYAASRRRKPDKQTGDAGPPK